jgi:hypothetical protein
LRVSRAFKANSMDIKLRLLMVTVLTIWATAGEVRASDPLAPYQTHFASPSHDEADSIPLGNGTTGIGLWAEEDGDLLFYLARNDAISEMQRLLKLGRIRIHLSTNPFAKGKPFSQTLLLRRGCCEIIAGENGAAVRMRIFLDSGSQTVYVEGTSDAPVTVTATLEDWRKQAKVLQPGEIDSTWIYRGGVPKGVENLESADVFVQHPTDVTWYHRDSQSPVPVHVKEQHLEAFHNVVVDTIINRTFGASMFGDGFVATGASAMSMRSARGAFDLRIATHAEQSPSGEAFLGDLRAAVRSSVAPDIAARRTERWWDEFWNRSWIYVDPTSPLSVPENHYALRFGADSAGGNVLRGSFGRIAVYDRALNRDEIATLAKVPGDRPAPIAGAAAEGIAAFSAHGAVDLAQGRLDGGFLEARDSAPWRFQTGFTLEAWIRPDAFGSRIFDKLTPGGEDGILLDSYGGKLRLIVGDQTFYGNAALAAGKWVHVAATADATTGDFTLYQDGQRVGGTSPPTTTPPVSQLTQAYILTRYQLACQERSSLPAHFNGGIFTVAPEFANYATDPTGKHWSADYRFYGPNLWWQNTRFLYQLHLAEGNFDLTDSFFDFYFRNMPLFEAKAKAYYHADGVYMNECLSLFGLPGMGDFGWGAADYSEPYTRNIWQQALEFGSIALDRYDYTGDETFLRRTIEWCDRALSFYDTRFKRDAAGKIIINPTHALETYWTGVTDDMPSIAGLMEITGRLLALPPALTTPEQRARWRRIAGAIPDLPKTKNKAGLVVLDAAQRYAPARTNYEAPELYCVYPFRIYGLNRPQHDIEEARRTWAGMVNKGHVCWYQTGIFAARLGLTEAAEQDVLIRSGPANRLRVAGDRNRLFRFPGYYGSPYDWCPDYDGAGNMANTLQEMLLQPGPGDQLLLLPSWPKNWNVSFKVHAPRQTTVECEYRDGHVVTLKVSPPERARDIRLQGGHP